MNQSIIPFADLQRLTGYHRQADVERCLKKQGVRLFVGRGGPWTTVEALHQALGIAKTPDQPPRIEFGG